MLKCKHIFQTKYTEAILSNSTRKTLWFEITRMLIAVKKLIYCVIYYNYNTKNCSLSIVLTATDHKPQKSLKRSYYPPSHRLNVNVMLSNMTFLMFLRFLIRRR